MAAFIRRECLVTSSAPLFLWNKSWQPWLNRRTLDENSATQFLFSRSVLEDKKKVLCLALALYLLFLYRCQAR